MPPDLLHPRPDLPLLAILGYAVTAFAIGLALTPWFIAFLRRNKLGKQLRVETVDGRDPTIFLKYHEKKFGTPTMGGLLIWGSILITVIFSRLLAFLGIVHNSLLQRGQVYLPLFVMVTLGMLGAVDDYLNIIGADQERLRQLMPRMRRFLVLSVLIVLLGWSAYLWFGLRTVDQALFAIAVKFLIAVIAILFVLSLFWIVVLGISSAGIDDLLNRFLVRQGKRRGLGVLPKITTLLLISGIGAFWFSFKLGYDVITVPFLGPWPVGLWYIPIVMFLIIGSANAVNVTDGLDGLAGGLLVIAFGAFGTLAYVHGLFILSAFCAVAVGAIAAFLWHNVPPALFFMGDAGSLALGGVLAVIALMTDQILILPLIGFVFVIEMFSVIIQLTSKKLRGGKKVFRAAPIHHHFEALEWGESKVTMRLWIVGAFMALLGIIIGMVG
ncbi:hypothetical protein HY285_02690 [Candidatus Peregrinibacteria bacterium]|nr:hypothetical protein [Candidatus Peregrinibacteria bacterium]MBI3816428.1 hypothetical protein [Candidatus Peregrinibacteria bacterium]